MKKSKGLEATKQGPCTSHLQIYDYKSLSQKSVLNATMHLQIPTQHAKRIQCLRLNEYKIASVMNGRKASRRELLKARSMS